MKFQHIVYNFGRKNPSVTNWGKLQVLQIVYNFGRRNSLEPIFGATHNSYKLCTILVGEILQSQFFGQFLQFVYNFGRRNPSGQIFGANFWGKLRVLQIVYNFGRKKSFRVNFWGKLLVQQVLYSFGWRNLSDN